MMGIKQVHIDRALDVLRRGPMTAATFASVMWPDRRFTSPGNASRAGHALLRAISELSLIDYQGGFWMVKGEVVQNPNNPASPESPEIQSLVPFIPDYAVRDAEEIRSTQAKPMESWAYFIQRGHVGSIKIGKADDPSERLCSLQTGHDEELKLLLAVRGGEPLETYLHKLFDSDRVRGEWFRPSFALLTFIEKTARVTPVDCVHASSIHPIAVMRLRSPPSEVNVPDASPTWVVLGKKLEELSRKLVEETDRADRAEAKVRDLIAAMETNNNGDTTAQVAE